MAKQNNYTLGRGKLYFARFKPGTTTPGGERYLGNTPEVSFSSDSQRLDHYNSDSGVRNKDASVLLQMDYAGGFSLDDIQFENLAMLFLGNSGVETVAAKTAQTETFTNVMPKLTYQLGTTASTPTGTRNVTVASVKDSTTTSTTYAAGTDYVVDEATGRITILEGTTIPADGGITVEWASEAYTQEFAVSDADTIEGQLRYVADNPMGENIDYLLPWVQITPDGDYALKGDDWQVMNFTLAILKKGDLKAVYANGRPYVS